MLHPLGFSALLLLTAIVISPSLSAEEVDDFAVDTKPIPNSGPGINTLVRYHLKVFVEGYNKGASGTECSRVDMGSQLVDFLDNNFTRIGGFLMDGNSAPERKESWGIFTTGPIEQSKTIYKDPAVSACCANSININGTSVGTDKIDHFFGNGGMIWKEFDGAMLSLTPKLKCIRGNRRRQTDEDCALSSSAGLSLMALDRGQQGAVAQAAKPGSASPRALNLQ